MQAEITIPTWATHIVSDHTDMDRDPHPVDAAKVARFSLELPDDVYYEYAFVDAEGRVRADPLNPERGVNPWYPEVSVLTGPDYRPHPLAGVGAAGATGDTTRHRLDSRALDQARRVVVYTPAGHQSAALPLVVVQDGTAYLRLAQLPAVLEALVAEGRARPAHLVFLEPIDRSAEYGFNPAYRDFVTDELLPYVAERHALTEECALLGASLGGLCSMTLALLHPELFGAVATQSGAFLGAPDDRDFYRSDASWVLDTLRSRQPDGLRVYAEVGTIEWLLGVNRDVRSALETGGYAHAYAERNSGHNWTTWRNGLADALAFVLG